MFRATTLSSSHYAGKWAIPDESQRNDLAAIYQLGLSYGKATDSETKEQMLRQLLESFHGYLMKYLVMIVRGTIPESNPRAGKDAKAFLYMLKPGSAPKGTDYSQATCKMLHLAFKQQTTEEIYDTLAFCFMSAARRYDPSHANNSIGTCMSRCSLWLRSPCWPSKSTPAKAPPSCNGHSSAKRQCSARGNGRDLSS